MLRLFSMVAIVAVAFVIGRQTVGYPQTVAPQTEYRTYCPATGGYWEPPLDLRQRLWGQTGAH